jgi:hypothetical protein
LWAILSRTSIWLRPRSVRPSSSPWQRGEIDLPLRGHFHPRFSEQFLHRFFGAVPNFAINSAKTDNLISPRFSVPLLNNCLEFLNSRCIRFPSRIALWTCFEALANHLRDTTQYPTILS